MPLSEPTVAFALMVLHVPPPVALDNVVVDPTHTFNVPVMAAGNVLTVISKVTRHPVGKVYEIVIVPGVSPVTTPPVLMDPTAGALLLQVPPGVVSDNGVVNPGQTVEAPVIGAGNGLTVNI